MKQTIASILLAALSAVGTAGPALAPQAPRFCERSNRAHLVAAQRSAEAEFWMRIAGALYAPGTNRIAAFREAHEELRSAQTLAQQVFEARESACALLGHERHAPEVHPEQFTTTVTNTFLPLAQGRVLVREKSTPEGLERIETSVSGETVDIGGVECLVVREYETIDGVLVEDTRNWVAQHVDGSVWYFGELALSYEDGQLASLDGSWRYGKDGAQPGILMMGTPELGAAYRQEFLLGTAEDVARIVRMDQTVTVPAGTFHGCLAILELDPLEPFEYLLTFIAPGVGMVLEIDTRTGERSELVEIRE